jgi:hypothetical protein
VPPVGEVVQVLHGADRHHRAGLLDLPDADLRQPDVSDLARVPQLLQGADLVGEGDLRVDAVELEQLDAVEPEAAQAHNCVASLRC